MSVLGLVCVNMTKLGVTLQEQQSAAINLPELLTKGMSDTK